MSTPTTVPGVGDAEFRSLWNEAHAAAASKTYKDLFTAEEAFAKILAGRNLGLSPADALRHMHLIDGNYVPSAEVQLSLLRRYVGPDGERYRHRVVTPAARRHRECTIEIQARDNPSVEWEQVGRAKFTLEDAERQGLGGDFWDRVPAKMLLWRAATLAIDEYAPEVKHPVHTPAATDAPEDVAAVDAPPLPVAEDPLDGIRVADPGRITRAQIQHIKRFVGEIQEKGENARLDSALDAVGAPEHEDFIQRIVGCDENQGIELIMRLGRHLRPRADSEDASGHAN